MITAIDSHAPSIERLQATIATRGISDRVRPVVGDMGKSGLPPESFDLIWSEGALYNLGIEVALGICHGLLRPGGYLAFTDARDLRRLGSAAQEEGQPLRNRRCALRAA